jgi:acetoin utilization protein AcuB
MSCDKAEIGEGIGTRRWFAHFGHVAGVRRNGLAIKALQPFIAAKEKEMLVGRRMSRQPIVVTPNETLAAARAKMEAGDFRELPVVEDEKLVGIITDRDLQRHAGYLERTLVDAAMTRNPLTVSSSAMLEEAAQILLRHKIGGLPVVDNDKLAGIITISDLLAAFLDLSAISEEGVCRIDLLLGDEPGEFARVADTVAKANGRILALGTYREEWRKTRVFYLRVRTDDPDRVAKALANNSFNVLGVHA